VEPRTVAEATMSQLESVFGQLEPLRQAKEKTYPGPTPKTNPASVTQLEYPISGGNETTNVANQSINHAPLVSLHRSATGSKAPNIRSLKTKNRIPSTSTNTLPAVNRTFCNVLNEV